MGRRTYSRQRNGKFRRATLENTFGLSAPPCPACRRLNPHAVGEPTPEKCHACGAPMRGEPCPSCSVPMITENGLWYCADEDAYHGEADIEDADEDR